MNTFPLNIDAMPIISIISIAGEFKCTLSCYYCSLVNLSINFQGLHVVFILLCQIILLWNTNKWHAYSSSNIFCLHLKINFLFIALLSHQWRPFCCLDETKRVLQKSKSAPDPCLYVQLIQYKFRKIHCCSKLEFLISYTVPTLCTDPYGSSIK